MARIVVGISGASGVILAHRLILKAALLGHEINFVMTSTSCITARIEMGDDFSSPQKFLNSFPEEAQKKITLYNINDFLAPIASGTCLFDSVVVIPCSMATLSAIAMGVSDNLLRRACDIGFKENRRVVIVPRELPLSEIHLENMLKIARIGGVIIPPQPAWYMNPKTLEDVENILVGRVLDALQIPNDYPRWKCMA